MEQGLARCAGRSGPYPRDMQCRGADLSEPDGIEDVDVGMGLIKEKNWYYI